MNKDLEAKFRDQFNFQYFGTDWYITWQNDIIAFFEEYNNNQLMKSLGITMDRPHINVLFDNDLQWVVELPMTYNTGIEYEWASTHQSKDLAVLEAKKIHTFTNLPIIIYSRVGTLQDILYKYK